MKKLIVILCAVFISTAVFADILIQQDFEGVGFTSEAVGDNLPSLKDNEGIEFTPSYGFSFTAVYEFNSDVASPVHWHAGLTCGADGPGFTALATAGLSADITQIGQLSIALRTDLKAGACMTIGDFTIPMVQTDIMLNIQKAGKKGPYVGVGITDHFQNMAFPALAMNDAHIINYTGLIFAVGWRF